jgi:hypothetical protein
MVEDSLPDASCRVEIRHHQTMQIRHFTAQKAPGSPL